MSESAFPGWPWTKGHREREKCLLPQEFSFYCQCKKVCSLKDLDLIREPRFFVLFCVLGWQMVLQKYSPIRSVINITSNLVCRSQFLSGLGIKISRLQDSVNDKRQESCHMRAQETVPGLSESGGSSLALGLCVFYLESPIPPEPNPVKERMELNSFQMLFCTEVSLPFRKIRQIGPKLLR